MILTKISTHLALSSAKVAAMFHKLILSAKMMISAYQLRRQAFKIYAAASLKIQMAYLTSLYLRLAIHSYLLLPLKSKRRNILLTRYWAAARKPMAISQPSPAKKERITCAPRQALIIPNPLSCPAALKPKALPMPALTSLILKLKTVKKARPLKA